MVIEDKSKIFYKNLFLPNSKLNFGENLLSKNNSEKAITFISENNFREERTWKELNENTSKIINFFKDRKIKKKDRIVAYLPNTIETVEAFIATTSIGAIWSSCSPDFGVRGVVERLIPTGSTNKDSTLCMLVSDVRNDASSSSIPRIIKVKTRQWI